MLIGISTTIFGQRCEDVGDSQRTQIFNVDDTLVPNSGARHCSIGIVLQEAAIATLGDPETGNWEAGSPRNRRV